MKNFRQIASLHILSITTGFLTKLGKGFLSTLYYAIDKSPYSTVIITEDESRNITGFVSGTVSIKKMYTWILLRYSHIFTVKILVFALKPSNFIKIIQTLTYSLKNKNESNKSENNYFVEAELLSIAVDSSNRGKGVGKKLLGDLEKWYRGKGITSYKTVTWSKDPDTNQFYLACGFILSNSFTHHNNVMNVYIKNLA